MLLAHLLAAVVTVILLRRGERAVLAAADWVLLRRPVLRLIPAVLPSSFGRRRFGSHRPPILHPFLDAVRSLQWRGPPAVSISC